MRPKFKWKFPYESQRMPVLASNIVCSSQPLASQAGLRMLMKGGNAIDAAIATAIALTVVEPTSNGIGSDAFALFWDGTQLKGLNASGKSPKAWDTEYFLSKYEKMPSLGWDTVTIPGCVSAWVELWKEYGTLEFGELFKPAIEYARNGFLVSPIIGLGWRLLKNQYKRFPEWFNTFTKNGKAPKPGDLFKLPNHADTLELIAETEGDAFYKGSLAEKFEEHAKSTGGYISMEDLRSHKPIWVDPISIDYNGIHLHEIPPNGQGIAALIMLGILKHFEISQYRPESLKGLHIQLEAMKLAFRDAHRYVSDPNHLEFDPKHLLDDDYLRERAKLISMKKAQDYDYGRPKVGDTVYLTAADSEGMMVSYIQSNFWSFGSGIVIPETGIALQNRGNGFTLEEGHPNQVSPSKRPYHTIIPAFVTKDGTPSMSFGVMGGHMQPQGHAQMITRIFDQKQNPQAACDAPRWQVMDGLQIKLEGRFSEKVVTGLQSLGHEITFGLDVDFGGAQLIYKLDRGYLGASEPRKDGQAVGF